MVRALTGIDADRLPEEKRRGITIDIGFADLDLGDVRIGFVDVPGHERFVKNMLAGAHGIDLVMLVIAADESVMPQTREHFDICRLLGVNRGVIVLTKSDLVDSDLLELARGEAEELVGGSFLEAAPIVPVSSRTGAGIDLLKAELRRVASEAPERSDEFITRLPIDRSFTMRGFGAVVTGTLIAGSIAEGDELELLPAETRARVRGVQVHGAGVKRATAGQRTAVNLGGVDAASIQRGMVLAPAGRLRTTQSVDASIQLLKAAPRALRSRQRVRVHIGAAEMLARVRVLEPGSEIKPGSEGFAQLRFERPIVGVLGDRFIVRSYSPQATVGGGRILDPFAPKHRRRDLPNVRQSLAMLRDGTRSQQLVEFVRTADRLGLTQDELVFRTAWSDRIIDQAVRDAVATGAVMQIEKTLLARASFDELKQRIVDRISVHHKSEPLSRGLAKEVLREQFFAGAGPELFRGALAELEKDGSLIAEKEIVRLQSHTRELSAADSSLRDALEEVFRNAGLAVPSLAEAFDRAGLNASNGRKILQLLVDAGVLVKVHGEMLFHQEALENLIVKLRAHVSQDPARTIDVGAFKDLAGISRKFAIPLLEYLDRERVTRRAGDRRVVL